MRPRHRLLTLALGIGAVACFDQPPLSTEPTVSAPLMGRAGPTSEVSVTSELLPGDGTTLSVQSDDGPYSDGVDGVSSILQGTTGDWVLDLSGRKSTRHARVDLGDPLAGNASAPPFESALVQPRFIAKASQVTSGSILGMTGLGSTTLSPLSLAFEHDGKSYGLRMNPANHPDTEWALVTCTGVADQGEPSTATCTQWEITPTGSHDGVTKNVAYLEEVTKRGSVFIGYYYAGFRISLSL